ncbi:hypothetical protein RJ639_031012 [Escallonia herrerae]|uniref:Uncharacterized protein n=1 Tax=Escallonia herrerae TaxID=1293975 RepID=A0AA89BM43_9ASTE|nr:hypothetical protein RJ639_031012 [Escallonia herrerae]
MGLGTLPKIGLQIYSSVVMPSDFIQEHCLTQQPSSLFPIFYRSSARSLCLQQELHRRRLKIKAISESKKKSKGIVGGTTEPHLKDVNATELRGESASNTVEDSSVPISKGSNIRAFSTKLQDDVKAKMPSNKRQKLHWGYHLPLFLLSLTQRKDGKGNPTCSSITISFQCSYLQQNLWSRTEAS